MKRIMAFGVFDGVHEGHRHFFREAKKFGDHLIVVVAPDEAARSIKKKTPKREISQRMAEVEDEPEVDEVVIGDEEPGTWTVIRRMRPDAVVVGYDQHLMKKHLGDLLEELGWLMEIETASAHEPHKYHSSIMDRKKK